MPVYSQKFKERAVYQKMRGDSYETIKSVLGVQKMTVFRWKQSGILPIFHALNEIPEFKNITALDSELKLQVTNITTDSNIENDRQTFDTPDVTIRGLMFFAEYWRIPHATRTKNKKQLIRLILRFFQTVLELIE